MENRRKWFITDIFLDWNSNFPFMNAEVNALVNRFNSDRFVCLLWPGGTGYIDNPRVSDAQYCEIEKKIMEWENSDAVKNREFNLNKDKIVKYHQEVLEICDATFRQLSTEYNADQAFVEKYENKRAQAGLDHIQNEHMFKTRLRYVIVVLFDFFRAKYDLGRMLSLGVKTKFSYEETEAVVVYLIEKGVVEFPSKPPFQKNTLLAMKAINRFAQENGISIDNVLELFCEYIGGPFKYSYFC